MILTLGYRGVFRQEQYETITIEGSIAVDEDKDPAYFAPEADPLAMMRGELLRLVGALIRDAADISRYDSDETVIYQWEGLIPDEASNTAPDRQPGRRVRRRS